MDEDTEICECGKTYDPEQCYGYCHACLGAFWWWTEINNHIRFPY